MQLQSSALWWRDSTLDISAGFQPNQSSTQYTASTHPDKTASTHPDRACYQQKAAMAATHFFSRSKMEFSVGKNETTSHWRDERGPLLGQCPTWPTDAAGQLAGRHGDSP